MRAFKMLSSLGCGLKFTTKLARNTMRDNLKNTNFLKFRGLGDGEYRYLLKKFFFQTRNLAKRDNNADTRNPTRFFVKDRFYGNAGRRTAFRK